MLKIIRRILLIALLVLGAAFLLYQGFLFWRALDKLPASTVVAGVPVGGLTPDVARDTVNQRLLSPITVYNDGERVAEIAPADIGFSIETEAMVEEARAAWQEQEMWLRYVEFVVGITPQPITVNIRARHDESALVNQLNMIANFIDRPAQGPQLLADSGEIQAGRPGYVTDLVTTGHQLRSALYNPDPDGRRVTLTMIEEPAPEWDLRVLQDAIENQLSAFEGFASVFILDLQTGEEVRINSDVPVSALSIMKIAIFVQAYRVLDEPPDAFQQELFLSTATASSNHSANLLLHLIAGQDNTYEGAAVLTREMQNMGMVNSFLAIPYDAAEVPSRPSTYVTPANANPTIDTRPDISRQTTAEDMGSLLAMIYYCAEGEGGLLAVYPGEITQEECQAIVDLMVLNVEGNLIRFGVPDGVPVSHKHGWNFNTHGDAGIVYTPGGDFVIYALLSQPESDWLSSEYSFPFLWELSRAAYNYFNPDNPFEGHSVEELERREEMRAGGN